MSDKYAFIDAEYAAACAPSIGRMCRWLQVSRSGYYEWLHRPVSGTAQRRECSRSKSRRGPGLRGTCGSWSLQGGGAEPVGPELVRELMRELGLVAAAAPGRDHERP